MLRDRFAPLLQKRATIDDPSRVIITASVGTIFGSLVLQPRMRNRN